MLEKYFSLSSGDRLVVDIVFLLFFILSGMLKWNLFARLREKIDRSPYVFRIMNFVSTLNKLFLIFLVLFLIVVIYWRV